ncbi:MAG: peptidoglycan DD-metalloendopeptidase family protein [Thermosynechococcaceae cyanobacterium]
MSRFRQNRFQAPALQRGRTSIGLCALFCLTLLVTLLLHSAPTVQAQGAGELQQRQQTVEQQREAITQQRRQVQQQEGIARENLQGVQRNLKATDAQIQENETKLTEAKTQLANLETDLTTAQASYEVKQGNTSARLRFLQRQRNTNTWATLLQSNTLEQLLERRRQLKMVYQSDSTALVSLKTERDRLNDQKLQVEIQKNQIALITGQLLGQKADFQAEAKAQGELVTRLQTDRQALEAAELQLSQDSERIAIMLRQRLSVPGIPGIPGAAPPPGSGQFQMPASGPITSGFGYRVHPVLGRGRLHAGMDIGVPTGTPIYAAEAGTVITAGWNGGYGNCVIIDHGGGLTTLYGHASELYVTAGQSVQRGQPIAAVGSTGLSTGPHLHFEVRVNGTPTDPAPYVA